MFLAGSAAALYYSHLGLALSHYDARAHLVVSRRILDSLVPGWQQVGAVWLPLPHLLGMLPAQLDTFYRTGAFAIALSVFSMALAAWSIARLVTRTTDTSIGGYTAAALLIANPNLLYLQSTPMTEPLLFGTTLLSVLCVAAWIDDGAVAYPHAAGLAVAAACMTRYEAWPISAALFCLAALVLVRRGIAIGRISAGLCRLAVYPAIAVLVFLANSRWTTGQWFVDSGFFVAENAARGNGWLALAQVREGMYALSGRLLIWPAFLAALLVAAACVRARAQATLLLLLAPVAAAALPWYAYFGGHPLRVRYSLALVFAACALCGAGVALLPRRIRLVAALVLVSGTVWQHPPLDLEARMVREAQRDTANRAGREAVTTYLRAHYDGTLVMMSMGSLAHYMHDLSASGFNIRSFLHEGNGELWVYALDRGPKGFVGWVAVEEQAEGGDALFQRGRVYPQFYRGFERVADGGGVALYRLRP